MTKTLKKVTENHDLTGAPISDEEKANAVNFSSFADIFESSIYPDSVIGAGTTIEGAVEVRPKAKIGKHTTLGAKAYIGYDATIGDHSKIGESSTIEDGALLNDHVTTLPKSTVGKGAILSSGITLGEGSEVAPVTAEGVRTSIPADFIWTEAPSTYIHTDPRTGKLRAEDLPKE